MSESPNALILDLLQWLAGGPRRYADVMEAWRTSCPRLTIWEDALEHGFVRRRRGDDGTALVELTTDGRNALAKERGCPARGRHGR